MFEFCGSSIYDIIIQYFQTKIKRRRLFLPECIATQNSFFSQNVLFSEFLIFPLRDYFVSIANLNSMSK